MTIPAAAFLLLAQVVRPPLAGAVDEALRPVRRDAVLKTVDDDAFLRRVTQDLLSQEPSTEELRKFAADRDYLKRLKKVDELLASKAFARAWAARFQDAFFGDPKKLKMEIPGLAPGTEEALVGKFSEWLALALEADKPWTEIVTAILDSRGQATEHPELAYKLSFERGREAPLEFAAGFSRHFLGLRLQCARCHDQPYDKWTLGDFYGLAAFNVRQRVRLDGGVVRLQYHDEGDLSLPDGGKAAAPRYLSGGQAGPRDDRMLKLAAFAAADPQLAAALANRVWAWLFGRGIVHPTDDFTLRNPPSSKVLGELAKHLRQNKHSLKSLLRGICASEIYQAEPVEVKEGTPLYRGLSSQRPYIQKPPQDWPAFATPEAWSRGERRLDIRYRWRVPDKEKKSRGADFGVQKSGTADLERKQSLETWTNQTVGAKVSSQKIEGGKHPATLFDLAGDYACDPDSDDRPPYRFLVGVVEMAPGRNWLFRLSGPADTVDDWREEFIQLLKGATSP